METQIVSKSTSVKMSRPSHITDQCTHNCSLVSGSLNCCPLYAHTHLQIPTHFVQVISRGGTRSGGPSNWSHRYHSAFSQKEVSNCMITLCLSLCSRVNDASCTMDILGWYRMDWIATLNDSIIESLRHWIMPYQYHYLTAFAVINAPSLINAPQKIFKNVELSN